MKTLLTILLICLASIKINGQDTNKNLPNRFTISDTNRLWIQRTRTIDTIRCIMLISDTASLNPAAFHYFGYYVSRRNAWEVEYLTNDKQKLPLRYVVWLANVTKKNR